MIYLLGGEYKLQIQYLTSKDYKIWDEFCEKHKYAIFMHTSYAMEYYIDSSFNIKSKQNSFFVYNNNNLVACVPLFVEEINEKNTYHMVGQHCLIH